MIWKLSKIELKNVFFKFQGVIIIFFEFKIKSGEKIGVLGESGSGKTTLMHILLGLYRPVKEIYFWIISRKQIQI